LNPSLSLESIDDAIKKAFERAKKDKEGKPIKILDNPQKLVKTCLQHLRERVDPVIGFSFYSELDASEVFIMDGVVVLFLFLL
jgi:hypothetical protein